MEGLETDAGQGDIDAGGFEFQVLLFLERGAKGLLPPSVSKRPSNRTGLKNKAYHLGLFRSDYMLHQESPASQAFSIKQVEFNTISVSFGALSEKAAALHR